MTRTTLRLGIDIAVTGLAAVRLAPLRSAVCVFAVAAALTPYLAGAGLVRGIEEQARQAANHGADLVLSGSQFGRPAPVPLASIDAIRRLDGVTAVVPRIVGRVVLGTARVSAVLVGMPAESFPDWAACVDGRLPRTSTAHEIVVGTSLARDLAVKVGSALPPFYRNDQSGERVSHVVGVFRPDAPLWQAAIILTTFADAAAIFEQSGLATELLVSCRTGESENVRRGILTRVSFADPNGNSTVRPRIRAREELLLLLPAGVLHRDGVFNVLYLAVFVVAILVLIVASGLGLAERRREIGILKALGWQTDEVLLRGLVESLVLAVTGAAMSILLAWVWLRLCNGFWIAGLFLAGAGASPAFPVPFRLAPVPVVLALALSSVVVASGALYSSWLAATTPPRQAMR